MPLGRVDGTPLRLHSNQSLRGPGGLHENFSEIDFLIVSDGGDEYLTAAFCPMKKYYS